MHLFASEEEGLAAQGGTSLAGFAGTLAELRAILDRGRIGRALAYSTLPVELWRRFLAPRWPQAEVEDRLLARAIAQNEWLCTACAPDQRLHSVVGAEATLAAQALRTHLDDLTRRFEVVAIKTHPALNFVFPDHPGYEPIYDFAESSGLVVIAHGGTSLGAFYESDIDYCAAERFLGVLQTHPNLRLVVSHLAYPYADGLVEMAASFPNLYTDLSYVLGSKLLSAEDIRGAVRAFGIQRVLLGLIFHTSIQKQALTDCSNAGSRGRT